MSRHSAVLPAQTAGGALSTTFAGLVETTDDTGNTITGVTLVAPAGYTTVTGVATNNVTFNVRVLRAGTSLGTVASLTLASGTNLVAETPVTVPITGSIATQRGDVLDVQMQQNGTGLAVAAGVICQVELN